jgi:hypothetical protein
MSKELIIIYNLYFYVYVNNKNFLKIKVKNNKRARDLCHILVEIVTYFSTFFALITTKNIRYFSVVLWQIYVILLK